MNTKRRKFKQGDIIGTWRLTGDTPWRGGNSKVWEVEKQDDPGISYALKLLNEDRYQDPTGKRYQRFKDEVIFVTKRSDPGILEIIGYNLPEKPNDSNRPWYVMPLANDLETLFEKDANRLESIIKTLLTAAQTLALLHRDGCAHRDIKPGNLLVHCGKVVLSDLGLVDYPDKSAVTEPTENLGPRHYTAPELMSDAADVDARPGDVYSFAKTIFTLSSGKEIPPQGHISASDSKVTLSSYVSHKYSNYLDQLIDHCTRNDPSRRPSMSEVSEELTKWLNLTAILTPPIQTEDDKQKKFQALSELISKTRATVPTFAPNESRTYLNKLNQFLNIFFKEVQKQTGGKVLNLDECHSFEVDESRRRCIVTTPQNSKTVDSQWYQRTCCQIDSINGDKVGIVVSVSIATFTTGFAEFCIFLYINRAAGIKPAQITGPPPSLPSIIAIGDPNSGSLVRKIWHIFGKEKRESVAIYSSLADAGSGLIGCTGRVLGELLEEAQKAPAR